MLDVIRLGCALEQREIGEASAGGQIDGLCDAFDYATWGQCVRKFSNRVTVQQEDASIGQIIDSHQESWIHHWCVASVVNPNSQPAP